MNEKWKTAQAIPSQQLYFESIGISNWRFRSRRGLSGQTCHNAWEALRNPSNTQQHNRHLGLPENWWHLQPGFNLIRVELCCDSITRHTVEITSFRNRILSNLMPCDASSVSCFNDLLRNSPQLLSPSRRVNPSKWCRLLRHFGRMSRFDSVEPYV